MIWAALAHAGELELGKKVASIDLTVVDGAVTVRQDPSADRARVITTDRADNRMCSVVVEETKTAATIRFAPKSANQPEKCAMDFEVVLRPDAGSAKVHVLSGPISLAGTARPVEAVADAGEVLVRGTTGEVKAVVERGDVQLADARGPLDLRVAAGNLRGTASGPIVAGVSGGVIELEGLAAPATLNTTTGRIVVRYETAPASGEISLRAANGDVSLDLPGASPVHCLVTATGGTASCELPDSKDAPLTVHAIADGGSVRVF